VVVFYRFFGIINRSMILDVGISNSRPITPGWHIRGRGIYCGINSSCI